MKYNARLIHRNEIDRLCSQLDTKGRKKYQYKSLNFNDNHDEIIDELKQNYDLVKYYMTTTSVSGYYNHFILYGKRKRV